MTWKHWYVYVNIAIILFGAGLFGYWYLLDGVFNPVVVYGGDSNHIQTDSTLYHRGDTIYVSFSYCKYRAIPAKVNWRLVDGQIILFSPIEKNIPIGCYGTENSNKSYRTSTITIPLNIEPGIWRLEGEVIYQINPVKTQSFERKTIDFMVI